MLAAFVGTASKSGYDLVRGALEAGARRAADFEQLWRSALHDGVVPDTRARRDVRRRRAPTGIRARAAPTVGATASSSTFRLDPYVLDGRFANNGWLQELPRPLTKLTWDNAALVAPATAERLGLASDDVVELTLPRPHGARRRSGSRPARRPDTVTVALGYGRTHAGRVGNGVGFDAGAHPAERRPLGRRRACSWRRPARRYALASTQDHHTHGGPAARPPGHARGVPRASPTSPRAQSSTSRHGR